MPCASAPVSTVCELLNLPLPAPRTIHTPPLSVADTARSILPSLSKSPVSFGLDSTPIANGFRKRLEQPRAVAAVQEHAQVGADLVHGGEVDEAVAVEVGGRCAVDARLRAAAIRHRLHLVERARRRLGLIRNWNA